MGIRDWFRRRKSAGDTEPPTPKVIGKSPGGSQLISYRGVEPVDGGSARASPHSEKHHRIREKAYDRIFGTSRKVFADDGESPPAIDVYAYEPSGDRAYFTLVTSGMSDLAMTVSEGAEELRRAELIFYLDELDRQSVHLLQSLAHFPHDYRSWLGPGHTIPNGQPPAPLFDGHVVDTCCFSSTVVRADRELELRIDGDVVQLLWVIPITSPERELKLREGMDAIYDLFDRERHPFVFSPARPRPSYI
jgi:hypothetical protein